MFNSMTICFIPYCNGEARFAMMFYYFSSKNSKKPFCKSLLHACEIHARKISDESVVVKIKRVLN